MPKAESSKDGARSFAPKRPLKVIEKTTDIMRKGEARATNQSSKSLPDSISVERFAETRAAEILAFQNAIRSAADQGSNRVFQSLPRHLRRRAASHNPRRVPKRLRYKAALEIAPGDNAVKIQRKRARLRAKGNLHGESRTEQLLKRQLDKRWLPTHIYHAKRFQMVNLWGYRLAVTPTLKSFRPAYRASRRKVMAVDTSYYGTIQLAGSRSDIIGILSQVTGGAFAGPRYESGRALAETTLYHPGAFPYRMIGPVHILWHDSGSRVWLRAHPAICPETLSVLQSLESPVEITNLSTELGSFELIGPQSGSLLRRVFKATDKSLQYLGDPRQLARGTVIACSVHDPRLTFPPQSVGDTAPNLSVDGISRGPTIISKSQTKLCESSERNAKPRFKKSDLDHRRKSGRLRPTAQDDSISILLVALGDRFLLLFPPAWSMPILSSMAHSGTLIGGLQERRAHLRELGIPSFPEHYGAACRAGQEWADARAAEDEARWGRKPPGKRSNRIWREDWRKVLGLNEEDKTNGSEIWLWPSELKVHVGDLEVLAAFRSARKMPPKAVDLRTGLVAVKLEMDGRGSPGRLAEIFPVDVDDLVGYTSTGNYSMARGSGFALAHVALSAWPKLDGRARVRNVDSVYREAVITLI